MGMEGEGEEEFSDKHDLIDNLKELEELISTLKADLDLGEDRKSTRLNSSHRL